MASMDIFRSDAFTMISMGRAVERQPYLPTWLGALDIFPPNPIRTSTLFVEELLGQISVIPTTPRGAPPTPLSAENRRRVRDLTVPRLAQRSTLYAHEIQSIRAFGSETELMQVQAEVARRQQRLDNNMELTWERHRLAALRGILLDSDGSTLYDFFAEFNVTEPAAITIAMGTAVAGEFTQFCLDLSRAMWRAAQGNTGPRSRILGLCGDAWFDGMRRHPDVVRTYENWEAAAQLRERQPWETFTFSNIDFVNYRGTDDGSTVAIPTNEARFVFTNAPDIFEVALAPAEFGPFLGTLGQLRYPMILPDPSGRQAFVEVEQYSYPLHICKRPDTLRRSTRT